MWVTQLILPLGLTQTRTIKLKTGMRILHLPFHRTKGPPVNERFSKWLQDFFPGVCKKEKLDLVLENTRSPENLEDFQISRSIKE